MSNTITSLLTRKSGTRGEILYKEPELFKIFTEAKCVSKTDMIMHLYGLGKPANSISKTLQAYGVLSEKSAYQHVRNTIERKTAAAVKKAS